MIGKILFLISFALRSLTHTSVMAVTKEGSFSRLFESPRLTNQIRGHLYIPTGQKYLKICSAVPSASHRRKGREVKLLAIFSLLRSGVCATQSPESVLSRSTYWCIQQYCRIWQTIGFLQTQFCRELRGTIQGGPIADRSA
jgi:hypothetical protein